MIAEGVGTSGTGKAILLSCVGDPTRRIAPQGIAGAIGVVLGLALAVASIGETVATAGGEIAVADTEVGIFVAPVVGHRGFRFEADLQE